MFLQRNHAHYSHYSYQTLNFRNYFHQPVEYLNNFEMYDPRVNLRRHAERSYSSDGGSREECLCSCNECYRPQACCRTVCDRCQVGYTYDNLYQPYHPLQQSSIMVLQYPVPVVVFPIKTVKTANKTFKVNDTTPPTVTTTDKEIPSTVGTTDIEYLNTEYSTTKTDPTTTDSTNTEENPTVTSSPPTQTSEKTPDKNNLKKTRMTRTLTPDFKRITNGMMKTTPKLGPSAPNGRIMDKTTKKDPKKITFPYQKEDLELLYQSSLEDYNMNSEYYDYPDEVIKKKMNQTKCENAANCYSRNWNRNGDPVKLYIETKSSLMPLVHLRPTLEKLVGRRSMAQTPKYEIKQGPKLRTPKYILKALNDKFAKKLMYELKNKKMLVLQNNVV